MAGNSIGELFRVTTFGESHGPAIGVVIDGCPSLIEISIPFIQAELARRKPGQSHLTSPRSEQDEVEILSGVFEGKTTGTPLTMIIRNMDQKPGDYDALKDVYRPSHADYTYLQKYGIRDHRGGGRSSARETAARVMAGAVAKLLLTKEGIQIFSFVSRVAGIEMNKPYHTLDLTQTEANAVRCPDAETAEKMIRKIEEAKAAKDSLGGIITTVVKGVKTGLGEPVFDKLHADLGKAMLSINACKGFDIGSGFEGVSMKGSEHNDVFVREESGTIRTATNHSGGVQGGISNGEDIYFRCAFKPVSTIGLSQHTITVKGGETTMEADGRHDPCVLPRAVPIVESMAAIVLADHYLRNQIHASRIR